jgi:hypothetical protein
MREQANQRERKGFGVGTAPLARTTSRGNHTLQDEKFNKRIIEWIANLD